MTSAERYLVGLTLARIATACSEMHVEAFEGFEELQYATTPSDRM